MKLAALAQRGSKKDFVDIFALGRRCFSLRQMLDHYRKKYGVDDFAHLLYSLAYFEDADRERMPRMCWDVDWRDMKETLKSWLQALN